MFNDEMRLALRQWYSREEVLDEARQLIENKDFVRLEESVHKLFLLPLSRHDELPDYMRDEEGGPLFPTNLSPLADESLWQDAIDVGWEIIHEKLGFSRDRLHMSIAQAQEEDWKSFLESVERREKERGQG